jgi:ATP-dependent Clp protease adaptor protein ClpS
MATLQRVEMQSSTLIFPSATIALGTIGSAIATPEKTAQTTWKPYPNFKVIILNDDFNTFEHVAQCLLKYIPHMTPDKAWQLTVEIDRDGQSIVWIGPQEQAELYHTQLGWEGLTMAPLEAA